MDAWTQSGMKSIKQILVLITCSLFHFIALIDVLGENAYTINKDMIETDTNIYKVKDKESDEEYELRKIVGELENERNELERLKIKFEKINQLSKQVKEDKAEAREILTKVEGNGEDKETTEDKLYSIEPSIEGNEPESNITLVKKVAEDEKKEIIIKKKDEIVNPFEIAENLYKLGEYKISLDIYKLIQEEEDDGERLWITYQIANCYRKLKQFDKAVDIYKRIQGEFEGSYWAKQSRWYIKDIEWRTEVKDKLETVIEK